MRVDDIFDNLTHLWDKRRASRGILFVEAAIPFFTELHNGRVFTDAELRNTTYYKYITDGWQGNKDRDLTAIIKDGVTLYYDIKANGMKNPIDFWIAREKLSLSKGARRTVITKLLGYKNLPVRIYRKEQFIKDGVTE